MKSSRSLTTGLTTTIILLGTAALSHAQSIQASQIPFFSTRAGLPAGGPASLCSNDIPTFKGAHVGDGCLPTQASLNTPSSTAIDAYGNIYISDYGDKLLRVIYQGGPVLASMLVAASPAVTNLSPVPGQIYTLAGSLQATLAQSGSPSKAYYCNGAGSGTVGLASNGDGCPATEGYVQPRGISVDANGNVFFANLAGGEGMRVVYAGGSAVAALITTLNPTVTAPQVGYIYSITGSSTAGYKGDGANARTAAFENVRDAVVDPSGNLYIADGNSAASTTNNNVRMINGTTGIITTIAGSTAGPAAACPSTGSYGGDDGPASKATLNSPYAMFMDAYSNLYIADSCNGRLRVIYAGGTIPGEANPVVGDIYTVAGGGTLTGATGVPATQLSIALMQSAGIDAAGNLYVVDNTNRYVWQIDSKTGIATLYGGLGVSGGTAVPGPVTGAYCSGSSGPKSADNEGGGCPSLQASISPSLRYIGDNLGNVYSIESGAGILRQYSLNNIFSATAVGSTATQPLAFTASSTDTFSLQGSATTEFSDAGGDTCATVASIPASTLCIYNVNFTPLQAGARKGSLQLGASGTGSTATALLSGNGVASQLSVDPGTQTILGSGLTPQGVAADLSGNLFVADSNANQVVAINVANKTGTPVITGLSGPNQVAIDGAGNLFVADTGNNRIAEQRAAGGSVISLGAGLSAPQGIAIDGVGNLYIADTGNNRVVEIAGGQQMTLPFSGLSHPSRIALDGSNDIFVADTGNNRVVEFIVGQGQVPVNTGSTTLKPAGVAIDAAGNLYIADATGLQVVELPVGTTSVNTLASNLKSPADLAAGPNASLYIADAQATGAIALNRSLGAINFPITNVSAGQTTNASITLSNTGNAPLAFPGPQLASTSGPSTVFSVAGATVNGCSVGAPVAPGNDCMLAGSFLPNTTGTLSQTFSFTTNAANGSSVQALLSGIGSNLISTSTTISITSPLTSTVGFGAPIVLSTVVSLSTNNGTPAGTITLAVDGNMQTSVPFGTGTVPNTLNLPVGTHVITAMFSGDSVYASSSSSTSVTVAKASTMTGLTISPVSSGSVPEITFTATVGSPTASGESGTISFYAGTTLITTSPLSGTSATYTTSNIAFSNNSFTAVYSGDANFSSSTSAISQPAPDFALTSSSSILAIAQGGVATGSVTITPLFGLSGTVTPSCGSLPSNTVCRFQPTSMSLSGNTPVAVSIQIYTNVSPTVASLNGHDSSLVSFAILGPSGLALLTLFANRRRSPPVRLLLLLIGTLCIAGGLTGCVQHQTALVTPAGTQNVTVTFTGSGSSAPPSHSITYSLTVNTP